MDRSSDSYFRANRPYQDQEVIKALEENHKQSKTNHQDFNAVMGSMEKSALENNEVMQKASEELSEQLEKQSELDREARAEQHAESMFQMQEVAFEISGLDGTVRESAEMLDNTYRKSSKMIAEQVRQSGVNIIAKIHETNQLLYSVNNNLLNINSSLQAIGDVLTTIKEKIETPNEVQAIELANQARISIAIGDTDEALRITRKAIELCSTSIIANAYHLMTLSLFDDKALKQESRKTFSKFVKLVGFKLSDAGSDKEAIHNEIYYSVFSTVFALSRSLGGRILDDTQTLYSHIAKDTELAKWFFVKPLEDKQALEKTLFPSKIRELTWHTILQQIIQNKQFDYLVPYTVKVADNKILLKNELLVLANKELYNSKVLQQLLNKTWQESSATEEELSCLNVFTSFQPQANIDINDKNLLLLDRYVDKYKLPINEQLKGIL